MLTESQLRFLTGYIGEEDVDPHWWCENCQSEKSPFQVTFNEICTVCGMPVVWIESNRTFLTWADLGVVKEKIEEKGEWRDFANYALDKYIEDGHWLETVEDCVEAIPWIVNPSRFCSLVCAWRG